MESLLFCWSRISVSEVRVQSSGHVRAARFRAKYGRWKPETTCAAPLRPHVREEQEQEASKLQAEHPKLFLAYFFMVFMRLGLEVGFMVGQYSLYTYKFVVPELWQCSHWPCPNVVDCFVSRPKEKTIQTCIFYVTGCIMVMLNVIELYHIGGNVGKAWSNRSNDVTKEVFGESAGPNFEAPRGMRHWVPGAEGMYQEYPSGYPDVTGIPRYTVVRRTANDVRLPQSEREN
ncbi:gap junction alpha-3 protein [Ciona intestinalis]